VLALEDIIAKGMAFGGITDTHITIGAFTIFSYACKTYIIGRRSAIVISRETIDYRLLPRYRAPSLYIGSLRLHCDGDIPPIDGPHSLPYGGALRVLSSACD